MSEKKCSIQQIIQTFLLNLSYSILEFVKKDDRKFRNSEGLIAFLFTQPLTKVKQLVDAGIYSENTARDYLNKLCDMQVLEKKEIEGHHYYLNLELYRILSE